MSINCMTLNCRSIRGKIAQLKVLIDDNSVVIAALQETWLNQGDASIYAQFTEMGLKSFKLERKDRRGGGLAILINSSMCRKVSSCYNYVYKSFDNIVCTTTLGKNKYNIVNIYRPPAQSKSEFLIDFGDFISHLLEENGVFVILGDFNIDLLSNNNITVEFLQILDRYDLLQTVKQPTRGSSLLDYIIINSAYSDTFMTINNIDSDFPSDHNPLFTKIILESPKMKVKDYVQQEIRNFTSLDYDLFRSELLNSALGSIDNLEQSNQDTYVDLYNRTITDLISNLCPKMVIRVRKDKSKRWFNKALQQLKQEKRRAERAYKKSPHSTNLCNAFKKAKNRYTNGIKKARTEFFSNKLIQFKNDPKNLHNTLKELTGHKKECVIPTHNTKNVIADSMANFYVEKVEKIRNKIILDNQNNTLLESLNTQNNENTSYSLDCFKEVDVCSIKRIVSGMKKKSCALDPAPTSVLMSCIDILCPIYAKIVNSSIANCVFPYDLKHAIVTPVLKNPTLDPESFKNYRPVSSFPFLAKIEEKVLHEQLNCYMEENMLYPSTQSSYREYHSCETALVRMSDDIQKFLHNKINVYLLLLDSSAAFDTVDQCILLNKLEKQYNVRGKALQMISSYFQDRTFSVKINEVQSSPKKLIHGVPQGSLLGPLFYILYTKEIEVIVQKHGLRIQSYADDCQIYVSFSDERKIEAENALKSCLNEIQSWMGRNFLKLNADKTKVKIFKHKMSLVSEISTIGETCPESVRVLGVLFNDDFKFNDFIKQKVKVCNFHLRNFYNIKDSLDISSRILLVTNFILATIDYCNILLLGATDRDLRPLRLMINKSLRFIYGVRYIDHITPFYKKAHFLPIRQRIKFKASMIAFKIFNNQSPAYFKNDFTKFFPSSSMTLREGPGRDKFMFKEDSSEIKSRRLSTLIKRQWNDLALELRKCCSKETFKARLKTCMFMEF